MKFQQCSRFQNPAVQSALTEIFHAAEYNTSLFLTWNINLHYKDHFALFIRLWTTLAEEQIRCCHSRHGDSTILQRVRDEDRELSVYSYICWCFAFALTAKELIHIFSILVQIMFASDHKTKVSALMDKHGQSFFFFGGGRIDRTYFQADHLLATQTEMQ